MTGNGEARAVKRASERTGICTEEPLRITLELDRRGFLGGVGVILGALPLQTLAADPARTGTVEGVGRRPLYSLYSPALYMQLAYFSSDGSGESYQPPQGNRATRDYVNSLSQEEFLRRHWFA